MSFLAALTDTVLLCSYPSRTAAERNNPLISFLCLSLPPFASLQHFTSVYWLCKHLAFILKAFVPILSCSSLSFNMVLLTTALPSVLHFTAFIFVLKQILLSCPLCNKSIQKHKYGRICTATWCCWCAEPISVMLIGTAWLVIQFLPFLSASSCLPLHFNCNLFSTGTFHLLFSWLVFSTMVTKISCS